MTAVKKNCCALRNDQPGACVDSFKVYCIGRIFIAEERGVTLIFANIAQHLKSDQPISLYR